jgi:hypothetical protein
MENLILRKSEKKGKRFDIVMPERGHVHSFGAKGGKTFIDGRTEKEKAAWEARHKRDKGYNNRHSGIYYSRFLLWGPFNNLKKNIKELEKRDNVKIKLQV